MTTPNLRSRHPTGAAGTSHQPSTNDTPPLPASPPTSSEDDTTNPPYGLPLSTSLRTFTPLDIIRLLSGLLILSSALSYLVTSTFTWTYHPSRFYHLILPLALTPAQLSLYNGTDPSLPIYLALNGTIYDVSANRGIYGPGGSYSFFAGRDASRAFVTGCFDSDLTGDMRGLEDMFLEEGFEEEEVPGGREERREWKVRREGQRRRARREVEEVVEGWRKVFDGGKGGKYFRVGRVVGGEVKGEKPRLCEKARGQRPKKKEREGGG